MFLTMKQSKDLSYRTDGCSDKFYAIFIPGGLIKDCIDAIRFISLPTEKKPAHITVRGPYKRRIAQKHLINFNNEIKGSFIRITGVGNFFSNNQNTVYLSCEGVTLRKTWKKKDYGYHPHITLYDGNDKKFSYDLYNALRKFKINLSFKAESLTLVKKSNGQISFELKLDLAKEILKNVLGNSLENYVDIEKLSADDKLSLIENIMKNLVKLPCPNKT